MTSKLEIFNNALQNLKVNFYLSSPDEDIQQAKDLSLAYDLCREFVLSEHHWTFATKRKALNRDAEMPDFGYQYQYTLPSDYIKIVETKNDESARYSNIQINQKYGTIFNDTDHSNAVDDYVIEGNKLLTNNTQMNIIYVYNIKDESVFSADFTMCLSFYLAFKTSGAIAGQVSTEMYQAYLTSLEKAKLRNAQQGRTRIRKNQNYLKDYL